MNESDIYTPPFGLDLRFVLTALGVNAEAVTEVELWQPSPERPKGELRVQLGDVCRRFAGVDEITQEERIMGQTEPLLLIHQFSEYKVGQPITVDDRPAIIREIRMNTGTVLRAEIEVFESFEARDAALANT